MVSTDQVLLKLIAAKKNFPSLEKICSPRSLIDKKNLLATETNDSLLGYRAGGGVR